MNKYRIVERKHRDSEYDCWMVQTFIDSAAGWVDNDGSGFSKLVFAQEEFDRLMGLEVISETVIEYPIPTMALRVYPTHARAKAFLDECLRKGGKIVHSKNTAILADGSEIRVCSASQTSDIDRIKGLRFDKLWVDPDCSDEVRDYFD